MGGHFCANTVSDSFEHIPRSGIAGSGNNSVYLLRDHYTIFPFNSEHCQANRQVERIV